MQAVTACCPHSAQCTVVPRAVNGTLRNLPGIVIFREDLLTTLVVS